MSTILFEQAINQVKDLILIKNRISAIYLKQNKNKESTAIQFKIKSYNKWIQLLQDFIKEKKTISNIDDIKTLKISSSLETKLIDIFENGEMKELEESKKELQYLDEDKDKNDDKNDDLNENLMNSCNSNRSDDDIIPPPLNNNTTTTTTTKKSSNMETNQVSKVKKTVNNGGVDTSKIEAVPKILATEERPTDERGGIIYDLRFIFGVGPKNAEKLADAGMTLDLLLQDWNQFIKKNPNNSILMLNKMPKPDNITKREWDMMSDDKKGTTLEQIMHDRLKNETKFLHKLTHDQILGIKYFQDITQKIPREEVQKMETILKKIANHMNPEIILNLCGSYRRGRAKSGDIDVLITHPQIKTKDDRDRAEHNLLDNFVKLLTSVGFLIDHLTDFGKTKYMGFCMVNQQGKKQNIARRIDIRFIPYNCYGAAILYFTGSKNFNTGMRIHAKNKGYKLSEYGVEKLSTGEIIPCQTEEEVFTILNYPYKKPEERDI